MWILKEKYIRENHKSIWNY